MDPEGKQVTIEFKTKLLPFMQYDAASNTLFLQPTTEGAYQIQMNL